jgi:hypothetical protein
VWERLWVTRGLLPVISEAEWVRMSMRDVGRVHGHDGRVLYCNARPETEVGEMHHTLSALPPPEKLKAIFIRIQPGCGNHRGTLPQQCSSPIQTPGVTEIVLCFCFLSALVRPGSGARVPPFACRHYLMSLWRRGSLIYMIRMIHAITPWTQSE